MESQSPVFTEDNSGFHFSSADSVGRSNEMLILPTVLQENKEKYSVFFVHLVSLYLKGSTLRFAVCDQPITFGGIEFIPFPVKIGVIKATTDSKRDNVSIEISDCTNEFKVALLSGEDFRGSTLEIVKISYPESLDDPTAYSIEFLGEIDSPKVDDATSTFTCTAKDVMSNYSIGRTLMLSCSAIFGDPEECGAVVDTATGSVQTGSTQTTIVLSSSYPINHWKYGMATVNGQTVGIIESSGNTVTTEYPFYTVPTGTYAVVSGCSKAFAFCGERYGNKMNCSAAPAIPFEIAVRT